MPITFTSPTSECATYVKLTQIDLRECIGTSRLTLNNNFTSIDNTFTRIFNWCSDEKKVDCVETLLGCYCGEPTPLKTEVGFVFGDGTGIRFRPPPVPENNASQCSIPIVNDSGEFDYVTTSDTAGLVKPINRKVLRAGTDKEFGPSSTGGVWTTVENGTLDLGTDYDSSKTIGAMIVAKATADVGQTGNVVGIRVLIGSNQIEVARAECGEQEFNRPMTLSDYDYGEITVPLNSTTVPYTIQYKDQNFYAGDFPGKGSAEIYLDATIEKFC